jgi:hypothetical protein
VAHWFSAPVSAAGNDCAAGSAVVRTTVAARNFQTGMRRLMNRSSDAESSRVTLHLALTVRVISNSQRQGVPE